MFEIHHTVRTQPFTMQKTDFHDMLEIYYLVKGDRDYFIEDRTYRISDGGVALINAYDLHRTIDTGAEYHERYVINFSRGFLSGEPKAEWLTEMFSTNMKCFHIRPEERPRVQQLCYEMTKEFEYPKLGSHLYIKSLFVQLLIVLYRALQSLNELGLEGQPVQSHHVSHKVITFIKEHYHEDLSLQSVAQEFYISSAYLCSVFKKNTGFTLIEYINHVRMIQAQKLLRESDKKVFRIAQEVGFRNIAHFGRVFKQVTSLTPLQYRRQHTR